MILKYMLPSLEPEHSRISMIKIKNTFSVLKGFYQITTLQVIILDYQYIHDFDLE